MLLLAHWRCASAHHWLVVVSEPNRGVDSPANCSAVDFVGNSSSLALDVAGDELEYEMADFHALAAAAFVEVAAERAAFGWHAFVAAFAVIGQV